MSARALVTLLGRRLDRHQPSYRSALYTLPDGSTHETPLLGLALAKYLKPNRIVMLGTSSSMWGAVVEGLVAGVGDEDLRIQLLEAEDRGSVDQGLLDQLAPLMTRAIGILIEPRLIGFADDADGQRQILKTIAECGGRDHLHLDITHGFRHLGMLGLLSAFMLARTQSVKVEGIWYGALDMTRDGRTPVLRLDGLLSIHQWIVALARFDESGNYGVFADLLMADGVAGDKAQCLRDAAFLESTLNLPDALKKLQTFHGILDQELPGASGLFQPKLRERLDWIKKDNLADHQRVLATKALGRKDFLRASIFGVEALVTRLCIEDGRDPHTRADRKAIEQELEGEMRERKHSERTREAYRSLKAVRNAMAHGTRPTSARLADVVRSPERLEAELRSCIDRLQQV